MLIRARLFSNLSSRCIGLNSPKTLGYQFLGRCASTSASTSTSTSNLNESINFRQQLKNSAKSHKKRKIETKENDLSDWELTIGIEIHAQLDSRHKLFSHAKTRFHSSFPNDDSNGSPNSNVSLCDLAYPGAQPILEVGALIPAIRAAVALNCDIQEKSTWDRKHYFYADQPAGYQITQFYQPFAKGGSIILDQSDDIDSQDDDTVNVRIKQIQLEQDTGKSIVQSSTSTLLDFNRVGHPLIEIISMPDIHYASTAAAFVRKVQKILYSVGAVTTGMESGGLRADVNVSVKKRGTNGSNTYYGVEGMGRRTEIKNLISFKAIEDAIKAERDRQIKVLEQGGQIEGETRGWMIGGHETYKLREKEGEIDYRYMPDPDLGPLIIPTRLVENVRNTLPELPDQTIKKLVDIYGLSETDARILYSLDDSLRLEYFFQVVHAVDESKESHRSIGEITGKIILQDIGAILSKHDMEWNNEVIESIKLAQIVQLIHRGSIKREGVRILLTELIDGNENNIENIAKDKQLFIETDSKELKEKMKLIIEEDVVLAAPVHIIEAVKNDRNSPKFKALVGISIIALEKNGVTGNSKRIDFIKKMIWEGIQYQDTTSDSFKLNKSSSKS